MANVKFSGEEAALMNDAAVILTKNSIVKKLYDLFGSLSDQYTKMLAGAGLPEEVLKVSPKIFKGENYHALPYVILDNPRFFSKEDVFAIRTMFWWGHYFSITLHLKGIYRQRYLSSIKKNYKMLSAENFHLAITEDEWQHHVEVDSFPALSSMDDKKFSALIDGSSFIKITGTIPLTMHDRTELLTEKMELLLKLLKD